MIQQHTFPKKEKLTSKKIIDALFIEGQSVKAFPLRIVFIETPLPYPEITIQASVSVSKRNHKLAVTRNRIKRLMREAYRIHKNMIDTKGTTFAILIIYTGRDVITYQEMERTMVKLLKRFNDAITTPHP
ncbi:ribonuclease P protein component [uncultured Dokdonia sp.]|uniref:ribonuclease P protein component n=1 Tax=uncultured Dokdonia sp. TaxID=575653 RepID=UPI00262B877F|nr:ribonuclease P protein component [uncultured Dokdonia sp.]